MNSVADVWDNVLSQLKGELSETTIATWFDELEAVDIQGNTFILHCSNDFKKGYIESLFMKNIKASLHDIFSTDFEVKILDDLITQSSRITARTARVSGSLPRSSHSRPSWWALPTSWLMPPPSPWRSILLRTTTPC